MSFVEKLAEAYTQTLQAGVLGIALAVILIALGLIVIIGFIIVDNRRREDRRATEHQTQVGFNQGLTSQLSQMTASIASVPDLLSLIRSSFEANSQQVTHDIQGLPDSTAQKIIAIQQPTFDKALGDHKTILAAVDDTKSKMQAMADHQATLISKLDALPENVKTAIQNDIASLASKINGIVEDLTSAKTTLALIYGKVTETPVTNVPTMPEPAKPVMEGAA